MGNTCFNKTSNNKTSEIKIICTQCNTLKLENDGLFKIIYDDLYFHTNNRVSYISDDIYDKYGNKIERYTYENITNKYECSNNHIFIINFNKLTKINNDL